MKQRVCRGMNYLNNPVVMAPNGLYSHGHSASEVNALVAFENTHGCGLRKPSIEDTDDMVVGEMKIAVDKLLRSMFNGNGDN